MESKIKGLQECVVLNGLPKAYKDSPLKAIEGELVMVDGIIDVRRRNAFRSVKIELIDPAGEYRPGDILLICRLREADKD